jgi:hypothetical protein
MSISGEWASDALSLSVLQLCDPANLHDRLRPLIDLHHFLSGWLGLWKGAAFSRAAKRQRRNCHQPPSTLGG